MTLKPGIVVLVRGYQEGGGGVSLQQVESCFTGEIDGPSSSNCLRLYRRI